MTGKLKNHGQDKRVGQGRIVNEMTDQTRKEKPNKRIISMSSEVFERRGEERRVNVITCLKWMERIVGKTI